MNLIDVVRQRENSPYWRDFSRIIARWILWNEGKDPPEPTGDQQADDLALFRAATERGERE